MTQAGAIANNTLKPEADDDKGTPLDAPPTRATPADAMPGRATLVVAWVVAGLLMLATLGTLGITRPQEARVLEVAREMVGTGWDGWMIPHANGQIRLHKPPLAYWIAAGGFKAFGVHDWAGRVPFAIATWLTVGLTYRFGKELFNARAGFYAAAMLFGSVLFSHFTRRGETDTLIILFVSAAIYCIWRALREGDGAGFRSRQTLWLHALGVMLGLTILAKGPPALFILFFCIAIAWWEWRWKVLGRFFTRGAIVTMLVIAAPWWIYMLALMGSARFQREISNVVEGTDHFKWFWTYFADLFVATAPWCALVLHSLIESAVRFRRDPRVQWPLIWAGVVFIPLCCVGNKQTHYLLPMLPPLMLIAGWGADLAARSSAVEGFGRGFRWVVLGTLAIALGGVFVLIAMPLVVLGTLGFVHLLSALLLAATVMVALVLYRRRGLGSSLNWTVLACGVVVSLLTSVYRATLHEDDMRGTVAEIEKAFGPSSYCVYQGPANLAMCFYLGQIIPTFDTAEQLESYAASRPNLVVIRVARLKDRPLEAPPGFARRLEVVNDGRRYTFHRPAAAQ